MAYFANGTEGDMYEMEWCERCVHLLEGDGCPCLEAHRLWSYDECNNPDSILHKMIPMDEHGRNGKCIFYRSRMGEKQIER